MEARRYSIVCGVGLNVNNRQPTTCLAELWGGDVSRERLLAEFMNEYEDAWERCVAIGNRDACPGLMVDGNGPVC
jgi:biotin-(acetyl-CoA carboxylase) ligase